MEPKGRIKLTFSLLKNFVLFGLHVLLGAKEPGPLLSIATLDGDSDSVLQRSAEPTACNPFCTRLRSHWRRKASVGPGVPFPGNQLVDIERMKPVGDLLWLRSVLDTVSWERGRVAYIRGGRSTILERGSFREEYGQRGARAYNKGLGALPPTLSRAEPLPPVRGGRSLLKLEAFLAFALPEEAHCRCGALAVAYKLF